MVDSFRAGLLPRLEHLAGFRSVSLLVDRQHDRAVAAVTYESRAAMHRAGGQGLALRTDFTRVTPLVARQVHAALHRAGAPSFGAAHGNWVGTLAQDTRCGPAGTWTTSCCCSVS